MDIFFLVLDEEDKFITYTFCFEDTIKMNVTEVKWYNSTTKERINGVLVGDKICHHNSMFLRVNQ